MTLVDAGELGCSTSSRDDQAEREPSRRGVDGTVYDGNRGDDRGEVDILAVSYNEVQRKYASREVRARVRVEYFEQLRKAVADAVEEELHRNGCDEPAGVAAAMQFLAEKRKHMALQVHAPSWGWQIERYRFTIRWRSTWIAKFQVDRTHRATNVRTNREFEDKLRDVVCVPACGKIACWAGSLLGL